MTTPRPAHGASPAEWRAWHRTQGKESKASLTAAEKALEALSNELGLAPEKVTPEVAEQWLQAASEDADFEALRDDAAAWRTQVALDESEASSRQKLTTPKPKASAAERLASLSSSDLDYAIETHKAKTADLERRYPGRGTGAPSEHVKRHQAALNDLYVLRAEAAQREDHQAVRAVMQEDFANRTRKEIDAVMSERSRATAEQARALREGATKIARFDVGRANQLRAQAVEVEQQFAEESSEEAISALVQKGASKRMADIESGRPAATRRVSLSESQQRAVRDALSDKVYAPLAQQALDATVEGWRDTPLARSILAERDRVSDYARGAASGASNQVN